MRDKQVRDVLSGISYRYKMVIVLSLGWAILQGGRFLLPPLLPHITDSLSISSGAAGLALTAYGVIYAVTQYPSGTYSDTLTRATVILPGFIVLLLSFSMFGLSTTLYAFILGIILLGIGKGLYASPTRALLADLFSDRRGQVLGIYSAGTDVGGLLAAGIAALVLTTTVWRAAYVPIVLVLLLVTLLYVLWNREGYDYEVVSLSPGATTQRLISTKTQREILVSYSLFYFAVGGLTNFYPLFLVEHSGYSETIASAGFAVVFGVGLLVKPTAGRVSDRLPRRAVSISGLLLAAIGFAVIIVAGSLAGVLLGTVLASVGYKTQFPITDALVMEAAPEGNVGADLGVARGVFLTANAMGPGVFGIVADTVSFAAAFWVLALSLVIAALVLSRQYLR